MDLGVLCCEQGLMGIVDVRGRHTGAPVWLEGEGVIILWGVKGQIIYLCIR